MKGMLLENMRKLAGIALFVAPIAVIQRNLATIDGWPLWQGFLFGTGLLAITAIGWRVYHGS